MGEPIVVNISGHAAGKASLEPKPLPAIAYISGHATGTYVRRLNAVSDYIEEQRLKGIEVTREEAAKELGFDNL